MAPVTCNRLSSFWPFAAVAAAAATSAYPESRGCAKTSVSPRRLVRLCGSLQFSGGWSFFACSYRCSSRRLRWAAEAPVRGRTSRTCARARAASCRHAASLRSSVVATSLNEKSNTSCSRKAARSSGDSRSSVKSSAMDKSSASSVRLSGASAAVSTTGSGSQGPTYSSRRARRGQHVETNPRRRGHYIYFLVCSALLVVRGRACGSVSIDT